MEVIYVIKKLKSIIGSRDLDVSLPFYTSNNIFLQDDSAEMNFQIAYNEFILNNNYKRNDLENNADTIALLKGVAKTVFRIENLCIAVVGNTNKITKKKIKEIVSEL